MGKKKETTTVEDMFIAFKQGKWQTMNWTSEKAYAVWSAFWDLLISSGFAFKKTDLIAIKETCSCCTGSNYDPTWHGVSEDHYSLAVRCGNLTFAYAFEELNKRVPFIGVGLAYERCYPRFSNHTTQPKSSGRLVIGTEFLWKGEAVRVTSFKDEKNSLIACAYHPDPEGYRPSRIKKRFTVTVKDFRCEMTKRRKAS